MNNQNKYNYNKLEMQDSLSINLALSQRDEEKFTESSMNKIGFIQKAKSKIEKITDQ